LNVAPKRAFVPGEKVLRLRLRLRSGLWLIASGYSEKVHMLRSSLTIVLSLIAVILAVLFAIHIRHTAAAASDLSAPTVVLYCGTDREVVQDLLDQFQKETGIHVDAKFDTEAAKAVGLMQEIEQEKSHPMGDVFWGGGPLFCARLAADGCLAPAPADLVKAVGDAPHDGQGRWLGFAGSCRVLLVNTNVLDAASMPHSYRDLTEARFKGHIGIANPLFGGQAAHVAALFSFVGDCPTREWLQGLKDNDCALCAGMADVKNRVASGELWFGITSTIDAHVAVAGGKPVKIIFPDQGPGEIGVFPHCGAVGRIAGGPHPKEAEKLLRFLLSTRAEKALAAGPGQNIGLLPGSVAQNVGPDWIPRKLKTMNVDWTDAANKYPASVKAIKQILLDQ
jgi:iron(III) transport system substrate-binding protein